MKKLILMASLQFSYSTFAQDCSFQAENYLSGVGYTQPGQLQSVDPQGHLHYLVRANQQGGNAAFEVIVTVRCELISVRTLWSE